MSVGGGAGAVLRAGSRGLGCSAAAARSVQRLHISHHPAPAPRHHTSPPTPPSANCHTPPEYHPPPAPQHPPGSCRRWSRGSCGACRWPPAPRWSRPAPRPPRPARRRARAGSCMMGRWAGRWGQAGRRRGGGRRSRREVGGRGSQERCCAHELLTDHGWRHAPVTFASVSRPPFTALPSPPSPQPHPNQRTCEWQTAAPARPPSSRRRSAAPCRGSAWWAASPSI